MSRKSFASLPVFAAAALGGVAGFAPDAAASSRFTIENQSDTQVHVYIYSGGDTFCTLEEKVKYLSAGETDSYGCTGNGKNQCKIQLYAKENLICKSDRNTCNSNAIKRENNSEMRITGSLESGFSCAF